MLDGLPAHDASRIDPKPATGRPAISAGKNRASIATAVVAWGYLAGILGIVALLRLAGDRWWPATLLTFGPRWIVIVPLPVLALLALGFRRRELIPLAVAGFVAIGPIMGFCLPWRTLLGGARAVEGNRSIRVLTINVGGGTELGQLADFIRRANPHIVIVAEWSSQSDIRAVLDDGWHFPHRSGVVIASRFPVVASQVLQSSRLERWNHPAFRCDLESPAGIVHVIGVHLETPREGLEEVIHSPRTGAAEMERTTTIRRTESELASRFAAEAKGPTIVAGDFNMPVDSTIYRQFWSGWQNAFSIAGFGFGQTKFTRRFGIRIDHVLAGRDWRVVKAEVGPFLGGDHRPVVVDLELR